MATGVEDGIVVFLLDAIEARRPVELSVGVGVLLEPPGDVGLEVRLVALGIERRATALGRREGELGAGILEHIVRRGEFLEPEAGLATRVAELVVRSKNHQDFHNALLSLVVDGVVRVTAPAAWGRATAIHQAHRCDENNAGEAGNAGSKSTRARLLGRRPRGSIS
jgi:hypothetical protein